MLPIEPVAFKLAVSYFKKKMDEINSLSKFMSPLISFICGEDYHIGIVCGTIWGSFPVLGSFAVQFTGIICGQYNYGLHVIFTEVWLGRILLWQVSGRGFRNLVPSVSHLPEERPWFELVTCLCIQMKSPSDRGWIFDLILSTLSMEVKVALLLYLES